MAESAAALRGDGSSAFGLPAALALGDGAGPALGLAVLAGLGVIPLLLKYLPRHRVPIPTGEVFFWRWLRDNNAQQLGAAVALVQLGLGVARGSLGAASFGLLLLVARAAVATAMHVVGRNADSPREVPPCAIPDFRRSRALHIRAWQRQRLVPVRLLALMAALPGVVAIVQAAVEAIVGTASASSATDAAVAAGASLARRLTWADHGEAVSSAALVAGLLEAASAVFTAQSILQTLLCWSRAEFNGVAWSQAAKDWAWDAPADEDEEEQQVAAVLPEEAALAFEAAVSTPAPAATGSGSPGAAAAAAATAAAAVAAAASDPVDLVKERPAAAYVLGTAAPTCGPCASGHYPWQTAPMRLDPCMGQPRLRIMILSVGTRGDVQPFIFLARSLQERGHDVFLCCPDQFVDLVTSHGVQHRSSGFHKVDQPDGWRTARTVAEMLSTCPQEMLANFLPAGIAILKAATDPKPVDLVISTCHTNGVGIALSEALDIAHWQTKLAPDPGTAAFAPPGYDTTEVGLMNRIKHMWYWIEVTIAIVGSPVGNQEQVFREKHLKLLHNNGLGDPMQRLTDIFYTPFLLGYSSLVFPIPDEEPAWAFDCGFWMDDQTQVSTEYEDSPDSDAELIRWLNSSRRRNIVAVNFGSMVHSNKGGLVDTIVRCALDVGMDVLLIAGWAEGIADVAKMKGVFRIQAVPHAYVFPLVDVVVHHGGAGTTAAVVAAGRPAVVIPILRWADQRQWGRNVEDLGLGVILDRADPPADDIRRALRKAVRMRKAVEPVAALVRGRAATELAARAVESCLCSQVLTAEEMAPLASLGPFPSTLSLKQRMCLRHCAYCRAWRKQQHALLVRSDEEARLEAAAAGAKAPTTPAGAEPLDAVASRLLWHPLDAMRLSQLVLPTGMPPRASLAPAAGGAAGTGAAGSAASAEAAGTPPSPASKVAAAPGSASSVASAAAVSPGRAAGRASQRTARLYSSVPIPASPAQRLRDSALRRESLQADDWRLRHVPRASVSGAEGAGGEVLVSAGALPPSAYRDIQRKRFASLDYRYGQDHSHLSEEEDEETEAEEEAEAERLAEAARGRTGRAGGESEDGQDEEDAGASGDDQDEEDEEDAGASDDEPAGEASPSLEPRGDTPPPGSPSADSPQRPASAKLVSAAMDDGVVAAAEPAAEPAEEPVPAADAATTDASAGLRRRSAAARQAVASEPAKDLAESRRRAVEALKELKAGQLDMPDTDTAEAPAAGAAARAKRHASASEQDEAGSQQQQQQGDADEDEGAKEEAEEDAGTPKEQPLADSPPVSSGPTTRRQSRSRSQAKAEEVAAAADAAAEDAEERPKPAGASKPKKAGTAASGGIARPSSKRRRRPTSARQLAATAPKPRRGLPAATPVRGGARGASGDDTTSSGSEDDDGSNDDGASDDDGVGIAMAVRKSPRRRRQSQRYSPTSFTPIAVKAASARSAAAPKAAGAAATKAAVASGKPAKAARGRSLGRGAAKAPRAPSPVDTGAAKRSSSRGSGSRRRSTRSTKA
ncbi:hypothetical protein FNF27_01618 [Cafeteria roenbergensis]|uniref:Glycosyltransferase family 28 N-terminal domain-containing protein n=2 Tax=Cafeteria roenbergensis TaxID=33653 RepID=A0A5A8EG11_CAFRO|nr:hypothetical protein FNF27_01618 [Cafeteria roenbergensis]